MRLLGVLMLSAVAAGAQERIIIDTDCGFFGDDGATIVMLARSPRFKIEAITTVSGNVWNRQASQFVLEILKLVGRSKVPVYMGAQMPLVHTQGMAKMEAGKWGPVTFDGAFSQKLPPDSPVGIRKEDAVQHLIRAVDIAPGELTLVALGPMTNIAMALKLRPDIAKNIKQVFFMGGQYRVAGNASKAAEFNFWFDPEAAQVLLRSAIPNKVMFGLDVTNKAMLDKTGFDEIISVRTRVTERFEDDFGKDYPGFLKNPSATASLFDALVSSWMIEPGAFGGEEKLHLDVETAFGPEYGKVIALDRTLATEATPVRMVNDVDYRRVFQLYRDLLQGK